MARERVKLMAGVTPKKPLVDRVVKLKYIRTCCWSSAARPSGQLNVWGMVKATT